ncbi:hypothetical protein [Teichococcus wenyumeiae]|uniref:hypothetical protein n=1 Tax=Teichococcus wenyumeiae TaxID=2478470 RepID=UPI0011C449D2|nr:hypothetical protein [Pseudoroseomonas wenyumeiae]
MTIKQRPKIDPLTNELHRGIGFSEELIAWSRNGVGISPAETGGVKKEAASWALPNSMRFAVGSALF